MRTLRDWTPVMGMALLALTIVRCGGDDICLNCDAVPTPTPGPRDVITIEGSIDNTNTFDDVTEITVIACFDLDPALTAPTDFNDCPAKSSTRPDSNRNFTLTNNLAVIGQDQASIRIGFWITRQDPPGGTIMDGDSFAELTEIASEVQNLEDVRVGQTAQMDPVDVTFATVEPNAPSGVATTSRIRVFTTPDTTPTPAPTSTP